MLLHTYLHRVFYLCIACCTRPTLSHKSCSALVSSQAPIAVRLAELLAYRPTPIVDASAHGPCMTIKSMGTNFPMTESGRRVWFAHARMAAVLGSCPKSLTASDLV